MLPILEPYLLKFFDVFLTLIHILFIVFILVGWHFKGSRRIHFWSVVVVGVFWFICGFYYGFGYCPLTDYHWRIKEGLGEKDLPYSFIEYVVERLSGVDFNTDIINYVTLSIFLFVFVVSLYYKFIKDINV
ncbi:MAG: DUF2784 domain-containing protein [Candidatus Hydrogenedentes bacterium]|nr:DUF2784 domain-containing protein [Candidatus Hydrogenedentota bacterium]